MANLTRSRSHANFSRTRLVFVRQPVKSVGSVDRDLLPVRLAIGVIAAAGILCLLWLMGLVGFHLGFAPAIEVPDLMMPPGGGLISGLRILSAFPEAVVRAAMAEPVLLMIGFLLIAIPAASLAVIGPPSTPGGPKPHLLAIVFAHTGAITTGLIALLLIAWVNSPLRLERLGAMPRDTEAFGPWLTQVHVTAGLDVLALAMASLWIVLVMRLRIPLWLKSLSTAAIFTAFGITIAATSVSAGTLANFSAPRMQSGDALILGHIEPQHIATMQQLDGTVVISIESPPQHLETTQSSIVTFLR